MKIGVQAGVRSSSHRCRVGPKKAFKAQEVWAIRFELQHRGALRDKCLFDLAIDSKLRGCDPVKLRVDDIASGGVVRHRAMVVQQKTGRPVQFELTETTRREHGCLARATTGDRGRLSLPEPDRANAIISAPANTQGSSAAGLQQELCPNLGDAG